MCLLTQIVMSHIPFLFCLPRCITGTPALTGPAYRQGRLTPAGLSLIAQRTLIYLPFKAHTKDKRNAPTEFFAVFYTKITSFSKF